MPTAALAAAFLGVPNVGLGHDSKLPLFTRRSLFSVAAGSSGQEQNRKRPSSNMSFRFTLIADVLAAAAWLPVCADSGRSRKRVAAATFGPSTRRAHRRRCAHNRTFTA